MRASILSQNPIPKPFKRIKTLPKPSPSSIPSPILSISNSIPPTVPSLRSSARHVPIDRRDDSHKTLLVEAFHHHKALKDLIEELSRGDSSPLDIFRRDGDWTKEQLWAAVVFLLEAGRIEEALSVFASWKNKETSRITVANYSRIIRLLCERNLMEEAVSAFQDMEEHGVAPSLAIYNDIIHGYSMKKEFDKSRAILTEMMKADILPTPETYNGLLRAYGNYKLYDEMSKCMKKMESDGCFPNEVTYNLLIVEFARGRLLNRMEGVYRTLLSKKMNLQPHTMVTMLEAYADLGMLEKMEKIYRRVLHSKAYMKENLVRKMAIVYIENCRFSRLEEFGNEVGARTGRNDLFWCILLLSCACLLSRKGIESVIQEMEIAKVGFSITFTNILGMFYLQIKNFRALNAALSRVETHNLKPDMVTFGILFDACKIGYSGTRVIEVWRRNGYLERAVEMETDPLVLAAFGKGSFIRDCEKLYGSLGSKVKEKKLWTYRDLISLVFGVERT